jgi:hypothetical protein
VNNVRTQIEDYTVPYPVTTDRVAKCHAESAVISSIIHYYLEGAMEDQETRKIGARHMADTALDFQRSPPALKSLGL